MLDPWIIEEIRRREQEEQESRQRPVLELPLDTPLETPAYPQGRPEDSGSERGVAIIDYSIG